MAAASSSSISNNQTATTEAKNSKNIVVLISGNGSNLQALIDTVHDSNEPITIRAVISNIADAFGLQRAKTADIDTHFINHKSFANRAEFEFELSQTIDKYNPDLVVLAGFMRILTPDFVNHYYGRMLNIHPSLLPNYQGLHTHQRVLAAGDKIHGASVHFVTEELDGGPTVLQAVVPVIDGDSIDSLAARVQVQEHLIYPQVVRWFCCERLTLHEGLAWFDNQVLSSQGIRINNTDSSAPPQE